MIKEKKVKQRRGIVVIREITQDEGKKKCIYDYDVAVIQWKTSCQIENLTRLIISYEIY